MTGFQYRVYGLIFVPIVQSRVLVPETGHAGADLCVSYCGREIGEHVPVPAPAWVARSDGFPLWTAQTAEGMYHRLRYEGAGTFGEFVFDPTGSRVWITWGEGVTRADLSAVLLGPVLGCVLRLRGVTCLHGSVVALDGQAVALLGSKGAGKSTTALSLAQRGGMPAERVAVLSDDLAALVDEGDRFRVQIGYPQLRLTPQAATALCGSYDGLRPLWSSRKERPQKRSLDLQRGDAWLCRGPMPLAALYLLGPRGQRAPFAGATGTAAASSTPLPPIAP